jgi:hypothetical protein
LRARAEYQIILTTVVRASRPLYLLICVASLLGVRPLHAQTPPRSRFRLEYTADPGATSRCADRAAFVARVGEFLGERDPFENGATQTLRITLMTTHARQVRGAYIVLRTGAPPSQPREFVANECEVVVSDLVRSVGLVLDPFALMQPQRPALPSPTVSASEVVPETARVERPPPVVLGVPVATPTALAPVAPAPTLHLSFGAGASLGAVASIAPLIYMGVSLRWTRFSFGLEARSDLPTSQNVPQVASARFSSASVGAMVVPCLAWRLLTGCAVIGIDAVFRDATGVPRASASVEPAVWAGARLAATWPLGDALALMVHGDVVVPLVRAVPVLRVDIDTTIVVWEPPLLHASIGLRLIVRIR